MNVVFVIEDITFKKDVVNTNLLATKILIDIVIVAMILALNFLILLDSILVLPLVG